MRKYQFKIISRVGTNLLVEIVRDDVPERCILPREVVMAGSDLTDEQINTGIPYGLPFRDFVVPSPDFGARLELALHRAGIWTVEDLRTKAQAVVNILQGTYHVELSKLVQSAEEYVKREHEPKTAVDTPITRQKKTKAKEKTNG